MFILRLLCHLLALCAWLLLLFLLFLAITKTPLHHMAALYWYQHSPSSLASVQSFFSSSILNDIWYGFIVKKILSQPIYAALLCSAALLFIAEFLIAMIYCGFTRKYISQVSSIFFLLAVITRKRRKTYIFHR